MTQPFPSASFLASAVPAAAQVPSEPATASLKAAENTGIERIGGLLGGNTAQAIRGLAADFPITARAVAVGFGDIYAPASPLDLKTRELITVAVLATLGHADPQFRLHLRGAVQAGASREEIFALLDQLYAYVGMPTALNAIASAREVLAEVFAPRAD